MLTELLASTARRLRAMRALPLRTGICGLYCQGSPTLGNTRLRMANNSRVLVEYALFVGGYCSWCFGSPKSLLMLRSLFVHATTRSLA